MAPKDTLTLLGAMLGTAGFLITAYDLWPEIGLHRARRAMAIAKAGLELPFVIQQNTLLEKGEVGPDNFGRPFNIGNVQFVSKMVRGYGLTDEMADRIRENLDTADRSLPKSLKGASFIFVAQSVVYGPQTTTDFLATRSGLVPEVRRFFEIEERLTDQEANFPTRWRPSLGLGIILLGISSLLQLLVAII
jgi:hypothetical protein